MANVGIGMRSYLGFGEESVFATIVPRTKFFDISSENVVKTRELIESGALYRTGILGTKVVQGQVGIAGDMEFEAQYEGWEVLAKHAFGSVQSTQQGATAAYRHLFTIADVLPTGLSLEIYRDTSNFASEASKAFVYAGCKITSISFSSAVGELLKVSGSVLGSNEERRTKSSEAFSTSPLAVYHQGLLKWNDVDAEVTNFRVMLNNQLDLRPKLNSQISREPIRNGKVECSGSFTAEFDSWTKYDDFLNAAQRTMNVRFIGPDIQPGFPYYIDLNLNIAIITGLRVNLSSPGRLILELDFKAYRTTTINELELEIQNTLTSISA
jgi:hypothetical protein